MKSITAMVVGTVVSTWLVGFIPLGWLPVKGMWLVIASRSLNVAISLILIRIFCPNILRKFRLRMSWKKALIAVGVVVLCVGPSVFVIPFREGLTYQLFAGFFFALWIGIDEEIFSRGLMYGAFEEYGVWIAATVSSVHFGLLHLGNIFWGGQSIAYTSGQIVDAASFGFLCCGLMILTGSIWPSIIMHGLSDTPMQFVSQSVYTSQVTGGTDWLPIIIVAIANVVIGAVLIQLSRVETGAEFKKLMLRFGLIEAEVVQPSTY